MSGGKQIGQIGRRTEKSWLECHPGDLGVILLITGCFGSQGYDQNCPVDVSLAVTPAVGETERS